MKIIKIPYDLTQPATVEEVTDALCLQQMKQLINIEWAEVVLTFLNSSDLHREFCLIVDEVGKLKDGWIDKINVRASQFYLGTQAGDPIVGDVILCAREWTYSFGECDLAGLEDSEIRSLMNYLQKENTDERKNSRNNK